MMKLLLTNNPLAAKKYENDLTVEYINAPLINILTAARDCIHMGYALLTHPVSSGVKPYESPYKSVLLTGEQSRLDYESLKIIEESIAVYNKFHQAGMDLPDDLSRECMVLDLDIIKAAKN